MSGVALPSDLRRFPSFSELTDQDLQWLRSEIQLRPYQARQEVFAAGEKAHGMFLVDSGKVKVFRVSANGAEQVLGIFSPGDEFAVTPVFYGGVYPASAETLEPSQLYFLRREALLHQIAQTPELALRLLASISKKLQGVVALVDTLAHRDAKGRLARYLVRLLDQNKNSGLVVELPMTKMLLAQHLGLKTETLSRSFRGLIEDGILGESRRSQIEIIDRPALYRAAGDEIEG